MPAGIFQKAVPRTLVRHLKDWVRRTARITASQMLARLYAPLQLREQDPLLVFDEQQFARAHTENHVEDIPIPDGSLRMGYGESPAEYLQMARNTASMLRAVMKEQNVVLDGNAAVLDWGCATGRVLQEFRIDAEKSEFWGADIDGSAIAWAKAHLSPPFNFVTCTVYPHLPFEDRSFSFIYGGSVFTHIRYLEDLWLMELRRILRPGGVMVLTILDESSVEWIRSHPGGPRRIPRGLDLARLTAHDQTYIAGDDWAGELSFFTSGWIRRSWGRYFEVADIKPCAEGYQTAVVLVRRA